MIQLLAWLIIVLGSINLIRLMVMMMGADMYDLKRAKLSAKRRHKPFISVIIPAYNEELVIERTLDSLNANTYFNKQVIVVNDGSKDATAALVNRWRRRAANKGLKLNLINQKNAGKAAAINNGMRKAKGSLIMVLDADSVLAADALSEVPKYFIDKRVVMAAANVKIIDDGRWFSLLQKYEYLISYRLKKSLAHYNMEYIIGGVGSTFRASMVRRVGGYDTDTITEDIDYTLKVLQHGNKKYRLTYAPSVHAYTEGVMTFRELIKQRYRWKYGRMQTFLKNRSLFFNRHKKYDKRLTMWQLPYAIWAEIMFSFEPLMIAYVLSVILVFHDLTTMASVYAVTTIYIILNVLFDESETVRAKLKLLPLSLLQYPLFLLLTLVEYGALIKSAARLHQLKSGLGHGTWEHVARSGKPVTVKANG